MDDCKELLGFVDAGASPFHAVGELTARLADAGFTPLSEQDHWQLAPGDCRYVVRDAGSVAAFRVGTEPPSAAGFRLIGAHTDSPTLKVRPRPDLERHGYRQVGVEPYGGLLAHTWLDRDLTLAGRVSVRDGDAVAEHLVHLPGAPLRIPSLAIHLDRKVNEEGLRLDPQRHLQPLWSIDPSASGLVAHLAAHLGVDAAQVLAYDLVTADTQPSATGGHDDAFVLAPRLDNLLSCYTGVRALVDAEPSAHTQVLVANDHEEVGSRTAEGAAGPFLQDTLQRICAATGDTDAQALARAAARSRLVSADTAHAVHPNYADRHEDSHRPLLGRGPVVKVNAGQAYATDAGSAAWFTARCADVDVSVQHFVSRADLPCGSTIGPLTAARLGIATVDVGSPLLSMHSCREQAAAADLAPMTAVLAAHLQAPD